ncbi:translation machinery-associated protein 20 [Collariella sp. IMI 366227]|nr:translation machinery-associated protein 20 [Collariella sp. IMI 366227]
MFKKDLHGSPNKNSNPPSSALSGNLSLPPIPCSPHIDEVLPKKSSLEQIKLPDRVSLYVLDNRPLFYQQDTVAHGLVLLPHLRVVHRFPECFPTIRIDRGAIRFVLSGATLMAPGVTSAGGRLPVVVDRDAIGGKDGEEEEEDEVKVPNEGVDEDGHWSRELEKGEPVVIMAEGKEHAAAVGILVMGTKETREKGKGPVMEDAHFLGDGLWRLNLD